MSFRDYGAKREPISSGDRFKILVNMQIETYVPSKRVYRRLEHRIVISTLFGMGVALFVAIAVSEGPIWTIGAGVFLFLAYRMWSIGVFLSSDGVRVRNFLWTRPFILWSDIDRFDLAKMKKGPSFLYSGEYSDGFPTGGVYLRSGAFVPSLALNPPHKALGPDSTIPRLLEQLNGELARAREFAAAPHRSGSNEQRA